jgi:uncharacterized tellurite resistance protein B-like protein
MPILLLIASTLLFWLIYWFVRMGGIDHFRERAAQRKDAARRLEARQAERTAPLKAIEDPRDAATVLMLLIPRGRDPTAAQIAAIEDIMRNVLGYDQDAHERLAHARFIAGRAESFSEAAGLFAGLFIKQLSVEERRELVEIVHRIAAIDGPSATQSSEIEALKRLVGLEPAR